MSQILFLPNNTAIISTVEKSLLELALKNKIHINHECGGMGTCGTCRVVISDEKSLLQKRNFIEREMAADRNFKSDERLSCQIRPVDGLVVTLPSVAQKTDL